MAENILHCFQTGLFRSAVALVQHSLGQTKSVPLRMTAQRQAVQMTSFEKALPWLVFVARPELRHANRRREKVCRTSAR